MLLSASSSLAQDQEHRMDWCEEIARIDSEMAELERRLHSLRMRRNSITLLYKLPQEIIEQILLITQAVSGQNEPDSLPVPEWAGHTTEFWVPLMGVCRRFRDVALASGALWCVIDAESKKRQWVELCVQRAGACALHIQGVVWHIHDDATSDLLALLSNHIHHVNRLYIRVRDAASHNRSRIDQDMAIKALMNDVMCQDGPMLTSLEIVWEESNHHLVLPGTQFLGGTPQSLTYLLLERCQYWLLPTIQSLRKLVMRHFKVDEKCWGLKRLLRHMPRVEALQLDQPQLMLEGEQAEFRSSWDSMSHVTLNSPVPLLSLVALEIRGGLVPGALLLQWIPDPLYTLVIHIEEKSDRGILEDLLPSVFMKENLVTMTRDIHRRVVRFLTTATTNLGKIHALPSITLNALPFGCVLVEMEPLFILPIHVRRMCTVALRLPLPGYDDLVPEIVSLTAAVRICKSTSLLYTAPYMGDLAFLHLLHIENVIFGGMEAFLAGGGDAARMPIDVGLSIQNEKRLDQFLEDQVNHQSAPIGILRLSYDIDCDMPSLQVRRALNKRWKDAKLVNEVEWVIDTDEVVA